MLTRMEPTLQIAEGAASNDPDVGLRAVAALRALAERLELLQVQTGARARLVLAGHRRAASASPSRPCTASTAADSGGDDVRALHPARPHVVVQAQDHARRLGHRYIGCEHLLLAAAATGQPASAVLRDQGVTPERVEAEIVRRSGWGQRPACSAASTGTRWRPSASTSTPSAPGSRRRSARTPSPAPSRPPAAADAAWGKGPLAALSRRRAAAAAPVATPRCRAGSRRRQPPASAGPGSRRPSPVHAARQEEPGAHPARGGGAARPQHRRPAPRARPAHHDRTARCR